MGKRSFLQSLLEITPFKNLRKLQNLVKRFLILVALGVFCSCVMDIKESPLCIKNRTNDTLLIDLSESDTLADWVYWSGVDDISTNNMDNVDMAFTKAIIGHLALPNTEIYVNPYVYRIKDTCYIYAIEWNIAKYYPMDKIRAKRMYSRRFVTKENFNDRQYNLYR